MKEDQERVKNLLVDTVTLLCKNSLQFDQELCVEGLLGVKVDTSDVFFLHISESFKNHVSRTDLSSSDDHLENADDCVVTENGGDCEKTQNTERCDKAEKTSNLQGELDREKCRLQENGEETEDIKTERTITVDERLVESAAVEHQMTNVLAKSVPLIAGQRRVPRKASSPHRNLAAISAELALGSTPSGTSDSDAAISSSGEADFSGGEEHRTLSSVDKRDIPKEITIEEEVGLDKRALCEVKEVENGPQSPPAYGPDTKVTPWPIIARQLELPSQPAPYPQAEGTTDIVNDLSQPGCSTWPSAGQHPAQQMELVAPPRHFMLTVPESPSILTPPRYPHRPSGGPAGGGGRAVRRRREWCGKWFHCDLCRYQTKRLWNLQRHMRKHVKGQVRCPLCDGGDTATPAYFGTEGELRHHLQLAHKGMVERLQQDGRLTTTSQHHAHLLLDLHTDHHLATVVKDETDLGGGEGESGQQQGVGGGEGTSSTDHSVGLVQRPAAGETHELLPPTSSVYSSNHKTYMYNGPQGTVSSHTN